MIAGVLVGSVLALCIRPHCWLFVLRTQQVIEPNVAYGRIISVVATAKTMVDCRCVIFRPNAEPMPGDLAENGNFSILANSR